jgi:hypothetical protein
VIASLHESGLSHRAIASATGLARNTVAKELSEVAQIEPPSLAPISDRTTTAEAEYIHCDTTVPLSQRSVAVPHSARARRRLVFRARYPVDVLMDHRQ